MDLVRNIFFLQLIVSLIFTCIDLEKSVYYFMFLAAPFGAMWMFQIYLNRKGFQNDEKMD